VPQRTPAVSVISKAALTANRSTDNKKTKNPGKTRLKKPRQLNTLKKPRQLNTITQQANPDLVASYDMARKRGRLLLPIPSTMRRLDTSSYYPAGREKVIFPHREHKMSNLSAEMAGTRSRQEKQRGIRTFDCNVPAFRHRLHPTRTLCRQQSEPLHASHLRIQIKSIHN